MSVRAKFHVGWKSQDGSQIQLSPVYSGSPENEQFFKATPGGQIQLYVTATEVAAKFEVGKEYFVDFTPAAP